MAKSGHKGKGQGHVTETPDVSHVRNVDVTHETSDVNVIAILKFVAGLVIMTVAVYVLMWLLFGFLNAEEVRKEGETPSGPMAMSEKENLPPEPRLQSARGFGIKLENKEWIDLESREPQAEYILLKEQWNQVLNEGPKDQVGNPAGLPIEEAMQKVLAGQGLPSRPPQGASEKMTDYIISIPTAASSGRVNEKVNQ